MQSSHPKAYPKPCTNESLVLWQQARKALFEACTYYLPDKRNAATKELPLAYQIECAASYLENTYLEDVYK